jgi:hypothetical protein
LAIVTQDNVPKGHSFANGTAQKTMI